MVITIQSNGIAYHTDLDQPLDISIPMIPNKPGVNCFYAPMPEAWPVVAGDFIGSIEAGGLLNFMNIKINPHGNGTHTECVGHILQGNYTINKCLESQHHFCQVVSVYPTREENGDLVISLSSFQGIELHKDIRALAIRTLPNRDEKVSFNYSGTNPAYLDKELIRFLRDRGVQHLLLDLPSVDREEDGGKLEAHKMFWIKNGAIQIKNTITELIFVPDAIKDGLYLLLIQIMPLELDVSPSKPVLFKLEKHESK
jgi:arylformamidase